MKTFLEFLETLVPNMTGTLHYEGNKLVLNIDPNLTKYYLKLIPKYHDAKPQMYPAHITVVRGGKETINKPAAWGKYEGKEIHFTYDNDIQSDATYFYLNAYSPELEKIREELGLTKIRPGFNSFHITIANVKT